MTSRAKPRHAAPTIGTRSRLGQLLSPGAGVRADPRARRRGFGVALLVAFASFLFLAQPISAVTTAGSPFGHLDQVTPVGQTGITLRGWAADPNAPSQSLTVRLLVDGKVAGSATTTLARADVARARGVGPTTGFGGNVAAVPGRHAICATAVNTGAGVDASLGCLAVVVPGLTPAQLAAHSPFGSLDRAAVSANAVSLVGWAADPDQLAQPLAITATVDAKAVTATVKATARKDVAAARHTGPNQGYLLAATVANGSHVLCAVAANLGAGNATTQLGCRRVQVGPPPPTAAQIAAHSPSGGIDSAVANSATKLTVTGWATDVDAAAIKVVAYLDGRSAVTGATSVARSDHGGARVGYSMAVPAVAGSHLVCLWAVNVGIGHNSYLGCSALSTPAIPMAAGPAPATPAANTKVTAVAAKYLGSRYVWGGASPATGFDCSGLVQYSYRTGAGITTPRVSEAQFAAARMIRAARAVPGDLVFFHDSTGNVYHVGILAKPGVMYAAVDEAEGVRYQNIWDSTATYGSFTHG